MPYALLALPLRFAVATVFWNSGTTKLASWDTTLALFRDEYQRAAAASGDRRLYVRLHRAIDAVPAGAGACSPVARRSCFSA